MGSRTNIIADHSVPDPLDRTAVLDRLAPALPEAMAVRDLWNTYDPEWAKGEGDRWEASPPSPPPHDRYVCYDAPGGLFVYFGSRVLNVRASLRWRGFLSIEPLRRVHLPAFRKIAGLLGASRIVYLHDDDLIILDAARLEGAPVEYCISELGRRWGPPQASVEDIEPEVVRATERGVPTVWYLEMLPVGLARVNYSWRGCSNARRCGDMERVI
jgi:hypothetical protein